MLNLNVSVTQFLTDHRYQLRLQPAMRPCALQLLKHERLSQPTRRQWENASPINSTTSNLCFNTPFFPFRLSVVKAHHAIVTAKEREILAREQTPLQNEQRLTSLLNQKDQEITSLQQFVSQRQQQPQQFSQQDIEVAVKHAIAQRDSRELHVLVMKREEEIAIAITKREEIMEAVHNREGEVDADAACVQCES